MKYPLHKKRGIHCTVRSIISFIIKKDLFVFSSEYPIEKLKEAVVARWRIDSLINYIARTYTNFTLINMSDIPIFHQGESGSSKARKKVLEDDFFYNKIFLSFDINGSLITHHKIIQYKRSWNYNMQNKNFTVCH